MPGGALLLPLEAPVRSLSELPGVGGRLAARLEAFFGGEAEALRAVMGCRLSLLSEAVGAAAAYRIVHGVYRLLYGRWPRSIAYSEEAWQLFTRARGVLEEFTASRPGRDIVLCGLPTPDPERAPLSRLYRWAANSGSLGALEAALERHGAGLSWPRPAGRPRLQRLLVVVGDRRAYEAALERYRGMLQVVYAEDPREVQAAAEGYEDVVVYDPYDIYQGPLPRAYSLDVEEVAPEAVLEPFRANARLVRLLAAIAETVGAEKLASLVASLGGSVEADDVRRLQAIAGLIGENWVSEAADAEYARLRRALAKLEEVVDDAEAWLNDMLRSELEKLEVKLPAARLLQLLSSLQRGEPPPPLELPEELLEAYGRLVREALGMVAEKLGLASDEARLLELIAPLAPSYPVEFNRESLGELRALLSVKLARRRLELLRKLASEARGLWATVDQLIQALALADAALALRRLRARTGLGCLAKVERGGLGVAFQDALEAEFVRSKARGGEPQPVSYIVGDVDGWKGVTRGERIVLLTGANSGGKTTLLKTVAETVLMSHAGLPVYAVDAWVSPFDTVVFISKPSGEVGAGALEAMLRSLAEIVAAPGRKLVLVDELEAATEAGAAAKILAGFIEELAARGDTVAVIVSHLASSILESLSASARARVRVDGIEAVGLDENYNLIVDRNPKYYLHARSTPELVVRRLLMTSKDGAERRFYQKLLEKLAG